MSAPSLEADCSQCAALCCVLLPFDRSEAFGFDKAGGEPCRHLAGDHSCRIHDELDARGFRGCVRFDCHGAGQRVVQEVFEDADWRTDPDLLAPMSDAFQKMRGIHELLVLLAEAGRLPLQQSQRGNLERLQAALTPPEGFTPSILSGFDLAARKAEVYAFLADLKDLVIEAMEPEHLRKRAAVSHPRNA